MPLSSGTAVLQAGRGRDSKVFVCPEMYLHLTQHPVLGSGPVTRDSRFAQFLPFFFLKALPQEGGISLNMKKS